MLRRSERSYNVNIEKQGKTKNGNTNGTWKKWSKRVGGDEMSFSGSFKIYALYLRKERFTTGLPYAPAMKNGKKRKRLWSYW